MRPDGLRNCQSSCIQSYSIISNDSGCNNQRLDSSGDTIIQVRVHQSIEIDVYVVARPLLRRNMAWPEVQ